MLDRVYSLINCSVRLTASQYFCEDIFEGGGWALVRRVRQGTRWHPATDDLRGTDVYGSAGTSTSDSTFSLPFASLITSSETLFLLANGMRRAAGMVLRFYLSCTDLLGACEYLYVGCVYTTYLV